MSKNSEGDDAGSQRKRKRVKTEDEFTRALHRKIMRSSFYARSDFEALLCYLLRSRWKGIYFLRVKLTFDGTLVGHPQIEV